MSASPQAAFQFQQSNLWHSGLSPHPYELIVLPNNVRVCYGCGSPFKEEERSFPNNVVIRHFDCRFIRRDESTRQPVFSVDFKNTYYHLDVSHVRRKIPIFMAKLLYLSNNTTHLTLLKMHAFRQVVVSILC